MTEQRDTFWLTVSQPGCRAHSGVNMEGWTGENGHEECAESALLWDAFAYTYRFLRLKLKLQCERAVD